MASTMQQQQQRSSYRSRTLSPRPVDNTADLDRKLDHLLEDLQVSLNEPVPNNTLNRKYGSQTHIESQRLQHPSPSSSLNQTNENSNYKMYKAAKYSYNVSSDNIPQQTRYQESQQKVQSNLTQLDTLLNNLKNVNMGSNNNIGTSSGSLGGNSNVVHKEYIIKTSKNDVRSEYIPQQQQIEHKFEYSGEENYGDHRKYKKTTNYSTDTLNSKLSNSERIIPVNNLNSTGSTPSRSFVYKKVESSKKNLVEDRPITPQSPKTSTVNKYNATVSTKSTEFTPPPITQCSTPNKKIFVYKEVTTKNVTDVTPPAPPKPQEPSQTTVIIKENTETKNTYVPPVVHNPKSDVEIIEKTENMYKQQQLPAQPVQQQKDNNVVYNYKAETHNNSTNNYINYMNNNNQIQKPQPFPVNEQIDGPPKKVDELMASLGPEPPNNAFNAGFNARQVEVVHEKHFNNKKEAVPEKKSKNLNNAPAVYYPPNQEIFTKREEVASYANGKGAIMRESGKYMYEADGKGKSKSSSGATVIPFCLPLCCGLPCSII